MALVPSSSDSAPHTPYQPDRSSLQAGWAVALLTVVFGLNQLDRGIVAILLESIKAEMQLSDTALGLMTGLGFSLVYSIMAFPLGRLADRADRIKIVSIGVMFYSVMAGLMGFAQNVYHLIALRSMVAVGEASGNAPSSAVIADLFPHEKRARATSIWAGGSYLGLFVGLSAGGWIHEHYGWRAALWSCALPGIVIGLLMLLTVKDPPRGAFDPAAARGRKQGSVSETVRFLLSQRTYVLLVISIMMATFTAYSLQSWTPSYLDRVHHLQKTEIGFYTGLFKGLMGLLGVLAGGFLTHQIMKKRPDAVGLLPVISSILTPVAIGTFLITDNATISLVCLAAAGFLIPSYQGPAVTMLHSVAPAGMRAFAMTMMFAAASLIGLGLGPLVVGALSDLFASKGEDSLRYALIFPAVLPFGTAIVFYLAWRNAGADQARILQAQTDAAAEGR